MKKYVPQTQPVCTVKKKQHKFVHFVQIFRGEKSQFGLVPRFWIWLFLVRFWLCNVELCLIHNLLDFYFCLTSFLRSESLQSRDEAQKKQFVFVPRPVGKWGAIVFDQPFRRGWCALGRRLWKWLLHLTPFPSSFADGGNLWTWRRVCQNSQLGYLRVLRHWRKLRHKCYLGLEVCWTRWSLWCGLRRLNCLGRCGFSLCTACLVVWIVMVIIIVATDVCHSTSGPSEGGNKVHKLSIFPSALQDLSLLLTFDLQSDFFQIPVSKVLPFSFALLGCKSKVSECKAQQNKILQLNNNANYSFMSK